MADAEDLSPLDQWSLLAKDQTVRIDLGEVVERDHVARHVAAVAAAVALALAVAAAVAQAAAVAAAVADELQSCSAELADRKCSWCLGNDRDNAVHAVTV